MLFGDSTIETEEHAAEKAIRQFLIGIDTKFAAAKIKIWRQPQICGLLHNFPAISLDIKNLPDFSLITHQRWSRRLEMQQGFVVAPEQRALIDAVRAGLREDDLGFVHIRVIGEPGIGKTRLILEATRADDLSPLVLYADGATKVDSSVITALMRAEHATIVLVIDECGPEFRSEVTRIFGTRGPSLKIVSIYQDFEEGDRTSQYRLLEPPPLPDEEIQAILMSYEIDSADASRWATLCGGSPRVAHVIGQNLKEHPEDPLRTDGISRIWIRYLASDVDAKSEEYQRRHLVLATLALFKRFGWGESVREEAYAIYKLILVKIDNNLSKRQFGNVIDQMIARKVLQGDNFLYITPRALHIRLWLDWWKQYRHAISVNELVRAFPQRLRQWFAEMFQYAQNEHATQQVVAELLGPGGPYEGADWLKSDEGAHFFLVSP